MSTGEALEMLREKRRMLTCQQYRTIKGQILSGDISGAERGLLRLTGNLNNLLTQKGDRKQ